MDSLGLTIFPHLITESILSATKGRFKIALIRLFNLEVKTDRFDAKVLVSMATTD